MKARRPKAQKIEKFGRGLVLEKHSDSPMITEHVEALANGWKDLDRMMADRKKQLQDASEAYSVSIFYIAILHNDEDDLYSSSIFQ